MLKPKGSALNKALRLLAFRAHSEDEVAEKLKTAGYLPEEIAETMQKLTQLGLLDDAAFAAQWAAFRARQGMGAFRIGQELRQKGVASDTVDEALLTLDEAESLAAAVALAEKHLRRGDENARRRAFAALNRRGFDYDLASKALREAAGNLDLALEE